VKFSLLFKKTTLLSFVGILVAMLSIATSSSIKAFPDDLQTHIAVTKKNTYLDRYGHRLNTTYENDWNIYDVVRLHDIPEFLRDAFLLSEDKRFFTHTGVDWLARANAARQNLLAGHIVRGASTITEQVVRMLHPRPRTFWARWIEGFEACALERKFSKLEILEFYLNQVPYKAKRRGVVQAAHYYFDRDLSTLNRKEMLALAILVRSPRWLDPKKQLASLDRSIADLIGRLELAQEAKSQVSQQKLALGQGASKQNMAHFIRYADDNIERYPLNSSAVNTTIDLDLQTKIQQILDSRLDSLQARHVDNGAVLVVDHTTNEILAWVVGYAGKQQKQYNEINAVTVRRQPGSTLKPLLYAKALEQGWTAASMLDDTPLEESVGLGMHTYHNYSRDHYGLISLREALGNSLNIPAIRAIQFVGPAQFLSFLHDLGIESLTGHPNVYGDGLALGNGEIQLLELVQAYTVLARMGDFKPLAIFEGEQSSNRSHRILSEDIASLIADIMSDPGAREKEFGWNSLLNFPYQTAVKTGTSSDYHDAWAIGFNDRYTVGIWVGNLDYRAMNKVTGSTGAVLALRSIFNELNKTREVRRLFFSKNLIKHRVCIETGLPADEESEARDEWFVPGTVPCGDEKVKERVRVRKPSNGLMMAMDPRIPDQDEYFEFAISNVPGIRKVKWYVNDEFAGQSEKATFVWPLSRGSYRAKAEVFFRDRDAAVLTDEVAYTVN